MFTIVRLATAAQNFRRNEAESETAEELPLEVALLQEIRDLLANGATPVDPSKP